MSIYSGFATRNQQQTYDQLIYELIQVLSRKILKTYHHQSTDQPKFTQIIKQIFMKLSLMEKQKYLQPNLSTALYDIMEYYLLQEKGTTIDQLDNKPKFWVKVPKDQQQIFTNDTNRNQKIQVQQRKTLSSFQIRNKTSVLNPQRGKNQRKLNKNEQDSIPLANKFIKQTAFVQKERQKPKKHQSFRLLQQDLFNQTITKREHTSKNSECPHCHKQVGQNSQKKYILSKKQRSQSLQRRQQGHNRIIIPELIKQYIETTNHNYMRQFRKRKIKHGPMYD